MINVIENDNIYNIIFEEKKTRHNIRKGINLVIIFIITLIVVSTSLNFIIKYKYEDVIEEIRNLKLNKNNMIITDYTSIVKEVSKSLVAINGYGEGVSSVTGVVITESGLILTSYSGIKDMEGFNITFDNDGEVSVEGKIVLENEKFDLALIQADYKEKFTPIKLADKNSIVEGQGIAILGSVYYENQKIQSITPGIISARHINFENYNSLSEKCDLIQISAPINSNNTGDPICNYKGELIGMGSLYLTKKIGLEGIYYGIELSDLNNITNSSAIIKEVLGIIEGGMLMHIEKGKHGFYIGQLQKDGNAYKSGIKPTDIILSIEGVNVSSINEINEILSSKDNRDSIYCEVLSNGIIKEVIIKCNTERN